MATRKLNKEQLIQLLEEMAVGKRVLKNLFAENGYDESAAHYCGEWLATDCILQIIKNDAFAVEMWDLYCGKEQTA